MKVSYFAKGLAALSLAATLAGCGVSTNGQGSVTINSAPPPGSTAPVGTFRTEQNRDATNFHAIENSAACSMVVDVGKPFKVVVAGEEKVIPEISTEVKDGVLTVKVDKNISAGSPIKVLVSMPKLDKYTTTGVSQTTITNVSEPFFTINQSGAGSITATGSADMVSLTMSGVGSANLKDLQGKAVTALLSGTGSAQVFAKESLTATVSGIGKLTYGGNPPKVQKNVTGLGTITAQ